MTLWLPLLAFAFGSLLVTAVTYALTTRTVTLDDRLRDVLGQSRAGPGCQRVIRSGRRVSETRRRAPSEIAEGPRQDSAPARAGRTSGPEALPVFLAIRVGFALAAFMFCMTPLLVKPNLPMALSAAGFGYVLPGMLLARKARRRQHRIRLSLADALDLLVVSVEAGLGLDQALARVGQELAFAYPDLSAELRLVNLELLAGKGRIGGAAQPRRSNRRRRPQLAGRDAGPDRQVRHERRELAARLLRHAANQAPSASRRSSGQDGREDGVPARRLHLSRRSGSSRSDRRPFSS